MRLKSYVAALLFLFALPAVAQVAPAAKVNSLPLGVGVGFLDDSIDYAPGDRMEGPAIWVNYYLFHGLSIETEGEGLLLGRPSHIPRFQQITALGGLTYHTRSFYGVHPYVKGMAGLTWGQFKVRDPFYSTDDFLTEAAGGGVEYRIWHNVYARGDYEYRWVHDYLSKRDLNPNGFTIGATYYLRGLHGR